MKNNLFGKEIGLVLIILSCSILAAKAQLSLPPVFSDNMVLQRGKPINIWGKAKPGEMVKIKLAKNNYEAKTDKKGNWSTVLEQLNVGEPLQLTIQSGLDELNFQNILVGEVWVCSGQSNMRWFLKNSINGREAIESANIPDLRLFDMESDIQPVAGAFSEEKLERLKNKDYFQAEGWKMSSPESVENFSAVAYYFGKHLLDSLKVPIGLIHNAIGGSTTDGWIDDTLLEQNQDLKFLVNKNHPWPDIDGIHPWVKSRSKENLALWEDKYPELLKNHPFAPGYLFETGIKPLIPFSMRGVIWYQGESNATHPTTHEKLFPLLIQNWREIWGQGDFPFLYVQLPNISSRNRWPEFREGQANFESIDNTGMAVIIDAGDAGDVHPKNKSVVGYRLALIAYDDVYGYDLVSRGPSYKGHSISESTLIINFNEEDGLKTIDGDTPTGFIIQGYDEKGQHEVIVMPKSVNIVENTIVIILPKAISPTKVKYAWSPNPEVNLYNGANLPMTPFKIELSGNN